MEHYFQAMKFKDAEHVENIRLSKNPTVAKRLGRSREYAIRRDWEHVKEDVMMTAIRAKFDQHEDLRSRLKETLEAELVEDAPSDAYWGRGKDYKGKNRLGVLLMELRDQIRREDAATSERE